MDTRMDPGYMGSREGTVGKGLYTVTMRATLAISEIEILVHFSHPVIQILF
jgi:hypothetical protein